jgi:hypothetical protein
LKKIKNGLFQHWFIWTIGANVVVGKHSNGFEEKLCAIEVKPLSSFEHFLHDFKLVREKLAISQLQSLRKVIEHLRQPVLQEIVTSRALVNHSKDINGYWPQIVRIEVGDQIAIGIEISMLYYQEPIDGKVNYSLKGFIVGA